MTKIMQAGLAAPSGCNKQTTSLIAVDDPEILNNRSLFVEVAMAVDNPNVIDGIGIDVGQNAICLLLTDHLLWTGDDALDEYTHLIMLQEKINAYISYIEAGQYKESYPNNNFSMAILEIHFKYDINDNCEKFLNTVQEQVGKLGIKIEAHIG